MPHADIRADETVPAISYYPLRRPNVLDITRAIVDALPTDAPDAVRVMQLSQLRVTDVERIARDATDYNPAALDTAANVTALRAVPDAVRDVALRRVLTAYNVPTVLHDDIVSRVTPTDDDKPDAKPARKPAKPASK